MIKEWTEEWVCPHCKGKVKGWYVFDDYGPAGGVSCENENKYQCSLTLAWEMKVKKRSEKVEANELEI